MKFCNIFTLSVLNILLSLPVISYGDNKTDYENVMILTSDGVFDEINQAHTPDPNRNFLRDRIGLDDGEIKQFLKDTENFYLSQFGLNFTNVPWENGVKIIPDVAIMEIRNFSDLINYRTKVINGKRVNYPVEAGGVFVNIIGRNVLYHGQFGGEEGKPAFPFDELASGYYWINQGHDKDPLILQFRQSTVPTRLTFEGWKMFISEISSPIFGEGKSDGLETIQQDKKNDRVRSIIRNVITFPGRLPDSELLL